MPGCNTAEGSRKEGSDIGQRRPKAFIDIGGDRECGAVVRMLSAVIDALEPCLVVVKSRNLFAALAPLLPSCAQGPQPPAIPPGDSGMLAALRDAVAPSSDAVAPSSDAVAPSSDAAVASCETARLRKLARRSERRAAAQSCAEARRGVAAGSEEGRGGRDDGAGKCGAEAPVEAGPRGAGEG